MEPPQPVPGANRAQPALPVVSQGQDRPDIDPMIVESEAQFDRWATVGSRTAQRPTLIFQGKVWLSGLPTEETKNLFPLVHLQICCYAGGLEKKGGIQLPGTLLRDVTPTWVAGRTDQWRLVWPLLRQSFHAGESILIHCKVGRHRGAAIGTLTRAILAQETIEERDRWIRDRRDTELEKVVNQRNVGAWLQDMRRQSVLSDPLPSITGFCSTARSHCHLQTGDGIPLCSHKQSSSRAAERLQGPISTTRVEEARAWSRPFCGACLGKAPASWQLKLEQF